MSLTGQQPETGVAFPPVAVIDGGIGTMDLTDVFELWKATTLEDLIGSEVTFKADLANAYPAEVASQIGAIADQVVTAVQAGYVLADEVPAFLYNLYQVQGLENLTPDMVSSGVLQLYAYIWGLAGGQINPITSPPPATGPAPTAPGPVGPPITAAQLKALNPPPAPVTAPAAPPAATKDTAGGNIVAQAVGQITPNRVQAQGVPDVTAAQVTAALQVQTNDLTALIAQATDQALGGLQPGQAKIALNRLHDVIGQVSATVGTLAGLVGGVSSPALQANQMAFGAAQAAQGLELDNLSTGLASNEAATAANTSAISAVEAKLPDFVTTPNWERTQQELTDVSQELAMESPSVVGTTATAAQVAADAAQAAADQAQDCCAEVTGGFDNAQNGIGGAGNWPNLGSLLGKLFELVAIGALVDAVITVLDWPASIAGTVWAAETVAPWAEQAATAAMADISWGDTVAA